MDEYEILANRTRDLEQEYTRRVFERYTRDIRTLKNEIEELQQGDSPDGTIDALKARIQELERERDANEDKHKKELEKLTRENTDVKKNKTTKGNGDSDDKLTTIINDQKEVLQLIRDFSMAQSSFKSHIIKLESELEKFRKNEKKLEIEMASIKTTSSFPADTVSLRKKINELEAEIETLNDKKYQNDKNAKMIGDQRDTIVLLEDSVANKNKVIESQAKEIARLKKESHNPFGDDMITLDQGHKDAEKKSISKTENPYEQIAPIAKKAKKEPVKKQVGGNIKTNSTVGKPKIPIKEDEVLVSVDKLIQNENKSFFNNLSFTNSSPTIDKTTKKKY